MKYVHILFLASCLFLTSATVFASDTVEDDSEENDDDIIIYSDDEIEFEASETDTYFLDDPDELEIVEESSKNSNEELRLSGALGRIWETIYISIEGESLSFLKWDRAGTSYKVQPHMLGELAFESWFIPAKNLSFFSRAYARVSVNDNNEQWKLQPTFILYESYAKINAQIGSMLIGRLVIPWGGTQAAALGDRLNPSDHRNNTNALMPLNFARQPQWGVQLQSSLGAISLEAVVFAFQEISAGSLIAEQQSGFRLANYQQALLKSSYHQKSILQSTNRKGLYQPKGLFESMTFALQAKRRVSDVLLASSVVFGQDDVPTLHLSPQLSQMMARSYVNESGMGLPCTAPSVKEAPLRRCLGTHSFSYQNNFSLAAQAEWGFGIVTLKTETVIYPKIESFSGKSALLISTDQGIYSQSFAQYNFSFAVESGFSHWFEGSLELFDRIWADVPANTHLLGIELLDDYQNQQRNVHRLAVATILKGDLVQDQLRWNFRGETGILQGDVRLSAESYYILPIDGLSLGMRINFFTGLKGSPGWLEENASLAGVFLRFRPEDSEI